MEPEAVSRLDYAREVVRTTKMLQDDLALTRLRSQQLVAESRRLRRERARKTARTPS